MTIDALFIKDFKNVFILQTSVLNFFTTSIQLQADAWKSSTKIALVKKISNIRKKASFWSLLLRIYFSSVVSELSDLEDLWAEVIFHSFDRKSISGFINTEILDCWREILDKVEIKEMSMSIFLLQKFNKLFFLTSSHWQLVL